MLIQNGHNKITNTMFIKILRKHISNINCSNKKGIQDAVQQMNTEILKKSTPWKKYFANIFKRNDMKIRDKKHVEFNENLDKISMHIEKQIYDDKSKKLQSYSTRTTRKSLKPLPPRSISRRSHSNRIYPSTDKTDITTTVYR